MAQPTSHIPFYRQMIALLRNAVDMLDEQGREEVLQFLISQQNPDGGFRDRGGRSDLYYSLFGGLMLGTWGMGQWAEGMELEYRRPKTEPESQRRVDPLWSTVNPKPDSYFSTEPILKIKQFIAQQSNADIPGFIEQCCLSLLQKELKVSRLSRIKTLLKLRRSFWKERRSINLSYRSFVLFLTLDAVLPFRRILKIGAKRMMAQTTVNQHSPCSEVAAKVFLQKMMNQDASKDEELLKSFACETGGFKAFSHLNNADMLSTAVALFALSFADYDLRLLKPVCLDFIGQNFSEGAFLSGDGDPTADVEYTFYGLLALGVLGD